MEYPEPNIQSMIRYHLDSGNIQKLEIFLELGYERLPRTRHYIRLMKRGFLKVTDYYQDKGKYFKALFNIEYARHLTPFHAKILKQEFDLIGLLQQKIQDDAIQKDIKIFRGIIHCLLQEYQERYPNLTKPLQELDKNLLSAIDNVADRIESKVTYHLQKLFLNMYDEMTRERQLRIISEIIGDKLFEEIVETHKREKEKANSEEN